MPASWAHEKSAPFDEWPEPERVKLAMNLQENSRMAVICATYLQANGPIGGNFDGARPLVTGEWSQRADAQLLKTVYLARCFQAEAE